MTYNKKNNKNNNNQPKLSITTTQSQNLGSYYTAKQIQYCPVDDKR